MQAHQSVVYQHAILVDQRNDIGDRPQRSQTHGRDQELPHGRADALSVARTLAHGPGQFERDARTAQAAERVQMPRQTRMHDGRRVRQLVPHFVMIGDDQFEARFARRLGLLHTGDPAVDRDDHRGTAVGQLTQRVIVESVAFVEPVGDIVSDVATEQSQTVAEQPGGGHAVGVVIAVHDHVAAELERPI